MTHGPHAKRLTTTACAVSVCAMLLLVGGKASRAVAAPSAVASRTIALSEVAHLRFTSHHGLTLNEQGRATGTISGVIYLHLKVVSTRRVTAEVNLYPSGGSLPARRPPATVRWARRRRSPAPSRSLAAPAATPMRAGPASASAE